MAEPMPPAPLQEVPPPKGPPEPLMAAMTTTIVRKSDLDKLDDAVPARSISREPVSLSTSKNQPRNGIQACTMSLER